MFWRAWCAVLCVSAGLDSALAADSAAAAKAAAAAPDTSLQTAARPLSAAAKLFAAAAPWRGTLGDQPLQATLRVKPDIEEGLEGEYFLFGHSQKILLAGEFDADGVFLEESENGTDVSGQWEGKLEGDVLRGTWSSADGTQTKSFMLKILHAPAKSAKSKTSARFSIDRTAAPPKSETKP